MEQKNFSFQITPLEEEYIPQISDALEKRTEILSRVKHPGMWKHTDKLNQIPKRKKSPMRTKLFSIINLALGIFLFVPGVMKPQELLVPLIVGAIGIGAGIGGLLRGKVKKKNRFDKPARQFWERVKDKTNTTVSFNDSGMTITSGDEVERAPYSGFEYMTETKDLLLVTFVGKVLVLQKMYLHEHCCISAPSFLSFHPSSS